LKDYVWMRSYENPSLLITERNSLTFLSRAPVWRENSIPTQFIPSHYLNFIERKDCKAYVKVSWIELHLKNLESWTRYFLYDHNFQFRWRLKRRFSNDNRNLITFLTFHRTLWLHTRRVFIYRKLNSLQKLNASFNTSSNQLLVNSLTPYLKSIFGELSKFEIVLNRAVWLMDKMTESYRIFSS
jgi:hypothetical protein